MFDIEQSCGAGPAFDAIVIGASLGGLPVLKTLLGALPADFPVPVLVVQHSGGRAPDLLVDLLRRSVAAPVGPIRDGAALEPGVHVLAPGGLATISPQRITEVRGEYSSRPIDALMHTAAVALEGRTCAVVLTGRLDDGAAGVRAVKRGGGRVIVQDPATARAAGMPNSALATGCVDLVLLPEVLGPALVALALAPGTNEMFNVPAAPWANLASA